MRRKSGSGCRMVLFWRKTSLSFHFSQKQTRLSECSIIYVIFFFFFFFFCIFFIHYLGISTASIICLIICFVFTPSISCSGVTMIRCCKHGMAACLISSGVTKSRPFMAAKALLALKIAMDARVRSQI